MQFDPSPLVSGQVDGWFSFVTNEPNLLKTQGVDDEDVPARRLQVPARLGDLRREEEQPHVEARRDQGDARGRHQGLAAEPEGPDASARSLAANVYGKDQKLTVAEQTLESTSENLAHLDRRHQGERPLHDHRLQLIDENISTLALAGHHHHQGEAVRHVGSRGGVLGAPRTEDVHHGVTDGDDPHLDGNRLRDERSQRDRRRWHLAASTREGVPLAPVGGGRARARRPRGARGLVHRAARTVGVWEVDHPADPRRPRSADQRAGARARRGSRGRAPQSSPRHRVPGGRVAAVAVGHHEHQAAARARGHQTGQGRDRRADQARRARGLRGRAARAALGRHAPTGRDRAGAA